MSTPTFPRRTFLRVAGLAPIAFSMPSYAASPVKRTAGPYLKPGLNVYSFSDLLTANAKDPSKGMDLFAVCDFAAKLNLDAVDLTGYFFPGYPKAPDDRYLNRMKRHTHDLGLDISGTGVRNDFATAEKAVRAAGVELTKVWIEVAARLGAPVIRVFAGPQAPYKDWQSASKNARREDVEGWMAEALHQCAEHGEKFGVQVAVQNHGDFVSTGAEHLSLLRRVYHDWCGLMVDTGKYLTEDPYADVAAVAGYAVNWQIKETLRSEMSSPRIDMKKLIKIIHASGYRGYLPIETLSMNRRDYDPAAEVTRLLAELREAIATVK
jgi:sugar phosphate isomerase/epimerase